MSEPEKPKSVLYSLPESTVDDNFITDLYRIRLDHHKELDDDLDITAFYSIPTTSTASPEGGSNVLTLPANGLKTDEEPGQASSTLTHLPAYGNLHCLNTNRFPKLNTDIDPEDAEEDYADACNTFYNEQNGGLVQTAQDKIIKAVEDGSILTNPAILTSFLLLACLDHKALQFTYRFAYPIVTTGFRWLPTETPSPLDSSECLSLSSKFYTRAASVPLNQRGFFLARRKQSGDGSNSELASWELANLSDSDTFFAGVSPESRFFGFADGSSSNAYPSSVMRNYLYLIERHWGLKSVQVLRFRNRINNGSPVSMVYKLEPGVANTDVIKTRIPQWEMCSIYGPRTVDLISLPGVDPTWLAERAVDLNLRLMRWNQAPDLDHDPIRNARCLLIGAGTLGTYVSRLLLAWGVHKITFVDNGLVSMSNPVRQCLYRFEDSFSGEGGSGKGVPKAARAAEALKEISPLVQSEGHRLTIPMLGHLIPDERIPAARKDFEKLHELYATHDVIFLLTDSRESRWLPTLMGKAMHKTVLNASLGFDSYNIIRHGIFSLGPNTDDGVELGCYFCNDVTSAGDSLTNAPLDQQCTVTRAGAAPIASGMLVEMFTALMQSPLRARTPPPAKVNARTTLKADAAGDENKDGRVRGEAPKVANPLGDIPHQVRGSLVDFSTLTYSRVPSEYCSACSWNIVKFFIGGIENYKNLSPEKLEEMAVTGVLDLDYSWDAVFGCCNRKSSVDDMCGLTKMRTATDNELMADPDGEGEDYEVMILSKDGEENKPEAKYESAQALGESPSGVPTALRSDNPDESPVDTPSETKANDSNETPIQIPGDDAADGSSQSAAEALVGKPLADSAAENLVAGSEQKDDKPDGAGSLSPKPDGLPKHPDQEPIVTDEASLVNDKPVETATTETGKGPDDGDEVQPGRIAERAAPGLTLLSEADGLVAATTNPLSKPLQAAVGRPSEESSAGGPTGEPVSIGKAADGKTESSLASHISEHAFEWRWQILVSTVGLGLSVLARAYFSTGGVSKG